MYRSIHTKRPLNFCWLSFSRIRAENSTMREMGMKKAGLFSKSGCNWRVTPGSNPSSKEKRANPIYENETQFLREKSPQTLGITGKKHCRTFLFGNDGGGGWIRTTVGVASRFTVCPLWPLGNTPIWNCGAGGRTRTPDLLITNQLLYQLSYTSNLMLDYYITKDFRCQENFLFF